MILTGTLLLLLFSSWFSYSWRLELEKSAASVSVTRGVCSGGYGGGGDSAPGWVPILDVHFLYKTAKVKLSFECSRKETLTI